MTRVVGDSSENSGERGGEVGEIGDPGASGEAGASGKIGCSANPAVADGHDKEGSWSTGFANCDSREPDAVLSLTDAWE